jgi:hypothetical protein
MLTRAQQDKAIQHLPISGLTAEKACRIRDKYCGDMQARDAAKARAGSAWGLNAFHTAAPNLGSIGLDPLTAALERL